MAAQGEGEGAQDVGRDRTESGHFDGVCNVSEPKMLAHQAGQSDSTAERFGRWEERNGMLRLERHRDPPRAGKEC